MSSLTKSSVKRYKQRSVLRPYDNDICPFFLKKSLIHGFQGRCDLHPIRRSGVNSYFNSNKRPCDEDIEQIVRKLAFCTNSNRLTAINKKIADSDLDGDFDQADRAQTVAQGLQVGSGNNKLLGFSQITTTTRGTRTLSTVNAQVNYALDAAGNLTSDGLRQFSYDANNRHVQTSVGFGSESSKITYLHNALGQRVFKSEPQIDQTAPNEATLGTPFVDWLKKNFGWLFAAGQANVTLGQTYLYADGQLPDYAMLGEYGNGAASGSGRTEYIYLPTDSGTAIPIGIFRSNRLFAVHTDHLSTPRQITDDTNKTVWQWPYSAFGDNKPTGILKATANPNNAYTQDPTTNARLQATGVALSYNPRFAGQYFDSESNLNQNFNRSYRFNDGRYTQADPIGLDGGLNRYLFVEGNSLMNIDPLGLAPGDKSFGIDDPNFWKWWEVQKRKGSWFTDAEQGFNPKKPFDIPNQSCADAVKQEYDGQKGNNKGNGRPGNNRGNPRPRGGGRGLD